MPSSACDLVRIEVHEPLDVDVPRAGDVTLPRVARVARSAVELVRACGRRALRPAQARSELVERDLAHSARTTSTSAAIAGRCSSSASHAANRSGSSTESMSRARITHGTYAMSE